MNHNRVLLISHWGLVLLFWGQAPAPNLASAHGSCYKPKTTYTSYTQIVLAQVQGV